MTRRSTGHITYHRTGHLDLLVTAWCLIHRKKKEDLVGPVVTG